MKRLSQHLLLAILTALSMSAFIYLSYFGIENKLLNSFFGLLAIYLILTLPKRAVLLSGFFVGIFWFYWIGFSFVYQGVGYMVPIVTLGFGILYLLLFLPFYFTDNPWLRALWLFALSFIDPMGWNWFKPELMFIESYFGVYKYQFAFLIAAVALFLELSKRFPRYRFAAAFLALFAINFGYPPQKEAPLSIKLVQTDIDQHLKWKREMFYDTVRMIFYNIIQAKNAGYDVVVLPESVFPLVLNRHPKLEKRLKELSHEITIIAGALYTEEGHHYNVSYIVEDGNITIAKKMVLVPFGEYVPLPSFLRDWVNKTFFQGMSDFVTAKKPTDFEIKGVTFRNAICYEATSKELFDDKVDYMIAISNNAWFAPSIEPTLQNLLMRYYARKYGVTIYHSANYKGSGIIR